MTTISARSTTSALVFLLGAAVFLNYVDRGAIGIAAPLMKTGLGLTEEQYGIVFSAFFWIYAPVQMFAGPRASGTWVGVQNAIGNLSGIVGPIVTGIVVQRSGYDSAFVLTAVVGAIGAAWWAFGVPKIEQIDLGQEQRAN